MSELTLLVLRLGFLALLWAFVFAIVYALRTDLLGTRARRMQGEPAPIAGAAAAPAPRRSSTPTPAEPSGPASRLVIVGGAKEGIELDLGRDPLTIGRSAESGLVIRDEYTSTHHARLVLWGDDWMVQDLDSTNGTFLDGQRVTGPTRVPLNTPVRIGTTSFELRS